ncbi:flagellar biosynthesis protein FlhA [Sphingomonas sp.]|uniref:flagellar biosynthesis protein FlhA n=1 Tax=Sphingomonas sp. TaxID=28214 RepID=UPI0025E44463|nr:flagellar biosynthesis protein FlhA [Sphingomonas sp.]
MLLVLVILFAPIPPAMLDLSIILNLGLALTILLLTFYVGKPVEFSTFPSLLLVATLFRLALNVAATRLILTGANAGDVINSIGSFAVQGNFVVGFVVFSILIVVQFVVVTSGAQRVSEVAARFTLDSMPGHQMSIDADLNMGLIDQKEAVRRREELEKEASFYGSMDGASKFVKGDAIAGIIIVLINIIAGWIIGVLEMGMGWSEALQRFTLLTIGDGIATQLPALIISVATGIIVTRSSADRELSTEVLKQLSSVPRIPLIVAGALGVLLLLPGMPKWPLVLIIGGAALAWWRIRQESGLDTAADNESEDESVPSSAPPAIEVRLGTLLAATYNSQAGELLDRIAGLRRQLEQQFGFAIPSVRVSEAAALGDQEYEIRLLGSRFAAASLFPGRILAIGDRSLDPGMEGIATIDPSFGVPALWIEPQNGDKARGSGFKLIDPITVIVTHLSEVIHGELSMLLSRGNVVKMLEDVRGRQPGLVEELVPNILSVSDVQRVFQNLVAEGVSVGNPDIIVEHLVDVARFQKDPSELTELIRQRTSYAICNQLRGVHDDLAVLNLDPRLENQIVSNLPQGQTGALLVEPRAAESLLRKLGVMVDAMHRDGRAPVLLCSAELRRHFKAFTKRAVPRLAVLSVNEIPNRISLTSFDVIRIDA